MTAWLWESSQKILVLLTTLLSSHAAGQQPAPLGVPDRGIFPDLSDQVRLDLPEATQHSEITAIIDTDRSLLVLYANRFPIKVYPLSAGPPGQVWPRALRPLDWLELAPLIRPGAIRHLAPDEIPWPGDRDEDGIPDPLDLLIGAHKTVLNGASYGAGYLKLAYPGGDVPRDRGVCTDVVVRAARNSGLDLQVAIHEDIVRSPESYQMVTRGPNPNIDHRRVKTSLPYFTRHWDQRSNHLTDPTDPLRPGDVLFMDTFPARRGPDHVGIVSNEIGPSGRPLVINNWSTGSVTAALDLLNWVPVTHRFRMPPASPGDDR